MKGLISLTGRHGVHTIIVWLKAFRSGGMQSVISSRDLLYFGSSSFLSVPERLVNDYAWSPRLRGEETGGIPHFFEGCASV